MKLVNIHLGIFLTILSLSEAKAQEVSQPISAPMKQAQYDKSKEVVNYPSPNTKDGSDVLTPKAQDTLRVLYINERKTILKQYKN